MATVLDCFPLLQGLPLPKAAIGTRGQVARTGSAVLIENCQRLSALGKNKPLGKNQNIFQLSERFHATAPTRGKRKLQLIPIPMVPMVRQNVLIINLATPRWGVNEARRVVGRSFKDGWQN